MIDKIKEDPMLAVWVVLVFLLLGGGRCGQPVQHQCEGREARTTTV